MLWLKARSKRSALKEQNTKSRIFDCMLIKTKSNWRLKKSANWCEPHIWDTKDWRKNSWVNYSASPFCWHKLVLNWRRLRWKVKMKGQNAIIWNVSETLVIKHNIKEKQKIQVVKSMPIYRAGGVSIWKREAFCRKTRHYMKTYREMEQ